MANDPLKDEIEARLLAGEAARVIAAKTAISVDVVMAYTDFFFDVTDALDATDRLLNQAARGWPGVQRPLTEGDAWRYLAVAAAPLAVDLLVDDYHGRPSPDADDRHLLASKARFLLRDYVCGNVAGMTESGSRLFAKVKNPHRGEAGEKLTALQVELLHKWTGRSATDQPHRITRQTRKRLARKETSHRRREKAKKGAKRRLPASPASTRRTLAGW